ncbi:hypothetical protein GCM10010145_24300 [Streptomyces ruber]|uniref:RDD domain-containing protein n=1 Tax=Streptomyces ruber TaxID=83378 RepID=A0A918BBL9_9ACTN|nr:RDD family protein [Streptomyces ruber]GGQ53996.1 hypothetical protein GCM10010145_24300 [Streptomyces ruber]
MGPTAPTAPAAPATSTGEPEQAPPAGGPHGGRPEPASAWGADRARQSGFGGDQDRRVSWGAPRGADPRKPAAQQEGAGEAARTAGDDGPAAAPPAQAQDQDAQPGTFVFRRPAAGAQPQAPEAAQQEGTLTFRAVPRARRQGGNTGAPARAGDRTPPAAPSPARPTTPAGPQQAPQPVPQQVPQQASQQVPQQASQQAAPQAPAQTPPPTPGHQQPGGGPVPTPMTPGPGGGQHSWAQQVHHLAAGGPAAAGTPAGSGDQPVAPWKPVVQDPFAAAVLNQAAARPAGLGKRLAARLLDTLVVGAVTAVAAVPLGGKALDHVNGKIDAAKLSGEQVTVWLLDGTTSVYLGIVLAVLLVFGALYEALPTAKWGHTLGKKLLGLEVRDIEGHEPPSFALALRRWLVYSVPGVLGIGIVGVLWCLFDRPWHQCWHDKAAHTFVAGRS